MIQQAETTRSITIPPEVTAVELKQSIQLSMMRSSLMQGPWTHKSMIKNFAKIDAISRQIHQRAPHLKNKIMVWRCQWCQLLVARTTTLNPHRLKVTKSNRPSFTGHYIQRSGGPRTIQQRLVTFSVCKRSLLAHIETVRVRCKLWLIRHLPRPWSLNKVTTWLKIRFYTVISSRLVKGHLVKMNNVRCAILLKPLLLAA